MFVFSNLATSIDGKIATKNRVSFPIGSEYDRAHMQVLRKEADAIIMGAGTLRTWKKPLLIRGWSGPHPMNVILSSSLDGISESWPFFKEKSLRRVLFVGPRAPRKKIQRFEKSCDVFQLKKSPATALQMIRDLGKLGVKRLLVEGGGGVMWDFASLDLIDEYHLTIVPRVIGGTEAPTLVDGAGFEPKGVVNLKLTQCRVVGDELYLIYRKRR
jgi:5-amino-6-(5-phosphoribosylamino)uracil reductase